MNEEKGIIYATRLALWLCGLVIVAAAVLGYTALMDLFNSTGLFHPYFGYLFPLLFDAAEVAAAVVVFGAALNGEKDRFAWSLVILFTILAIMANITHSGFAYLEGRIELDQAILAGCLTALFPLSVALVTHLSKKVVARHLARTGRTTRLARLSEQETTLTQRVTDLTQQVTDLSARRATLVNQVSDLTGQVARQVTDKVDLQGQLLSWLEDNPEATYLDMAGQVDRSESTIKNWVREMKGNGQLTKNGHGWEVVNG